MEPQHYVDVLLSKPKNIVQLYSFRTKREEELHAARCTHSWPHNAPGSIFVAPIGTNWAKGCWQAVVDMVLHTAATGLQCWMEEIAPSGYFPQLDANRLRDRAVHFAQDGGFEWLCLVDNDMKPAPDTLLKLMRHELPIMAPLIIEPGVGKSIGSPELIPDRGLQPAKWVSLSFLLIRTSVFNTGVTFMSSPEEGMLFQRFWHFGHRAWVDTAVGVEMTQPPARRSGKSWKENWDSLKRNYNQSFDGSYPDRAAADPNNPFMVKGVYVPYIFPRDGHEAV